MIVNGTDYSPMRGQIVIRETRVEGRLWTPDPKNTTTHVGRVLAMGAPARTLNGVEIDAGFKPGDLVQYHFTHLEAAATYRLEDGMKVVWIPQENVDGVYDAQ